VSVGVNACPGCGRSLQGGRFAACPGCGFVLKAGTYGPSQATAAGSPQTNTTAHPPFQGSSIATPRHPTQQLVPTTQGTMPSLHLRSDLFSFVGRIHRASFILLSIACAVIFYVLIILIGICIEISDQFTAPFIFFFAALIALFIFNVWASIALGVKRLHDLNLSGAHMIWIYLLNVFIGLLSPFIIFSWGVVLVMLGALLSCGIMLWLSCTPGTNGDNKYGPPRLLVPGIAPIHTP
jgi:uncharacterized membrane protein YhaH (DUF805 family)